MDELAALASEALSAERRNILEKVAAGATLTANEREILRDAIEPPGSQGHEALATERQTALIRRWKKGGRLSKEEREEIAHLLPKATAEKKSPVCVAPSATGQAEESIEAAPGQPAEILAAGIDEAAPPASHSPPWTERDILALYDLSRATFYRWKQYGARLDEPDLPPWHDAKALAGWYERMKIRGLFKHRCPSKITELARLASTTPPPPASSPPGQLRPAFAAPASDRAAPRAAPVATGFLAELEALQKQTAILREDFIAAQDLGEIDRANLLKGQYFEILETLRKMEKDKEQIATAAGELVRKTDVERDLAERLPAIVSNLEAMIDRIDHKLAAAPDRATRRQIWREHLAQCFEVMATSRFSPALTLDAAA